MKQQSRHLANSSALHSSDRRRGGDTPGTEAPGDEPWACPPGRVLRRRPRCARTRSFLVSWEPSCGVVLGGSLQPKRETLILHRWGRIFGIRWWRFWAGYFSFNIWLFPRFSIGIIIMWAMKIIADRFSVSRLSSDLKHFLSFLFYSHVICNCTETNDYGQTSLCTQSEP